MVKLFDIANVQADIKQIQVFDDFAVVIDLDDAMHVAIRPTSGNGDAIYSVPPVKGITTNFLWKLGTPIVAYHIAQTRRANEFVVNMIVRNGTALLPEQYDLVVEKREGTADFTQRVIQNANTTIQLSYEDISNIELTNLFCVISCTECNGRTGVIQIYSDDFKQMQEIVGTGRTWRIGQ